jgi:hypothetical protein
VHSSEQTVPLLFLRQRALSVSAGGCVSTPSSFIGSVGRFLEKWVMPRLCAMRKTKVRSELSPRNRGSASHSAMKMS